MRASRLNLQKMISVVELLAVVTVLACSFLAYVKWVQNYWARRNVPYIEPTSIFGNVENPFNLKDGLLLKVKGVYDELKTRGHKNGGMYILTTPTYVPVDVDLIKRILTRDFQHFTDRGFFAIDEKKDPLSGHLFSLEGEKWKNLRVKLTPTFTSGKMKMMFNTLLDCGVPMLEHIDNLIEKQNKSLDMKVILSCFTTDVIGSCVFGLECNSFKNPDSEFRKYGREVLVPTFRAIFSQFVNFTVPSVFKYSGFKTTSAGVEKFFITTVKDVLDYRRRHSIRRNDFIHLFIEMQDKAKEANVKGLTIEQVAAQSFLFFIAGFDTSATTMSYCLHELAFDQDIQDKLREEVRRTLTQNGGVLTYESVMEMEYMDRVVSETLRKYPPVPFLNRECSIDYKVPDTDVTIEKGTKVFISTLGLHRDEEFYPDPEKFDPERFTDENKANRHPFSFIPFGEGPRVCVGLRFGLMQTKTGLAMLLNKFKITPGMGEKYSFAVEPQGFVMTKKGGILVNAEKLCDSI